VIFVYIVLGVVACAFVGRLLTGRRDQTAGSSRSNGRLWPWSNAMVDPVENPRAVDDGTDYGYREFD
jgi:hypothetical protein